MQLDEPDQGTGDCVPGIVDDASADRRADGEQFGR
jgi:hypothetical protein